ncbi:MAG: secondary thiamine-phosphate synthase enzyme YjbQ [bacterium]
MKIVSLEFSIKTNGNGHTCDITPEVSQHLINTRLRSGTVTIFVPGSTAAITTIEYESGAISDFNDAFERAVPKNIPYKHDQRWGDGNGFSHVRAAWLGPSVTVPFIDGEMCLGTWQQVVLVDFDRHPRNRKIVLQIIGE